MSNDVNDPKYGAEDSFENMKLFAKNNKFTFPYVYDETQNTGRTYDAVCTPDFFGLMLKMNFSIEVGLRLRSNN
jgi:hypothetical protein